MLTESKKTDLTQAEKLESVEAQLLQFPQMNCSVVHHFGPGIYIREVHLPAGGIAIGHHQKFEHMNVMLTGKVAMIDNDEVKVLEAPMIFVGKPGRKIGYIIEDTVWQNIYATDETDVDKLEAFYLDKSETWNVNNDEMNELQKCKHVDDRFDYEQLLIQLDITEEQVRTESEFEDDQIQMPSPYSSNVTIRNSAIEGKGVFLSSPVKAGNVICPARLADFRTPVGRFTNHSKYPNAKFVEDDIGDIYLVALKDINGCIGGDQGEEVTVNYRQALSLKGIHVEQLK